MKFKWLYFVLFFVLSFPCQAQNKDNTAIEWLTFEQLTDSLNHKPKKVLLFFHTDWCTYCRKMMRETFRSEAIAQKVKDDYYAIHFDAESIDTVRFEGNIYTNSQRKKRTGQYHSLAKLLIGQDKPIFPTTIILDEEFKVFFFKQKYLSIREFLNFL